MAWNEPGKGGKDRDPWGDKGRDQGPPDLDELFKKVSSKLGGKGGKFGGSGDGGNGFGGGVSNLGIGLVLGIAFVVWVMSGFYTVAESDRGVVLRFGKMHNVVEPGLRWKPTFIDEVTPININSVRQMPVRGFMLTQDENVVQVEMDVQYRVFDPYKYLFSATNADDSLNQAMDSALRFVVGHSTMDAVLTVGREQVRSETSDLLEEIIEPYDIGLQVVDVNFQSSRPPEEVKDAFDDAIAAQEDEERFVREAEAYAREVEPRARGTAQRITQEANAYRERVVLEAQGEVARFEQLLPEYQMAPEVTRQRLYIDAVESVMSKTSKVMVDTKESGNMIYLPIDKMIGTSGASTKQETSSMSENWQPTNRSSSTSSSTRSSSSRSTSSGTSDALRPDRATTQGRN